MESYKKIDIDTWVRREHYLYYTQKLKIEYNMTANINVKELLDFCHIYNYKFYPAIIYFITKVLNKIDNFKMFKDKEQNFIKMTVRFRIAGLIIRMILKYFIMILCWI